MVKNFCTGRAGLRDISSHLHCCDSKFVPTLSSRLDIDKYSKKILEHAKIFEAWVDDDLVGLVAVYCNSSEGVAAFITNVSVLPSWVGKGIATQLIDYCILQVTQLGFKRIDLEVSKDNQAAIALYEKHGFTTTGNCGLTQKMTAYLKKDFE
jgi:ribosomal protein S18 acetylase RimI-like enzyme